MNTPTAVPHFSIIIPARNEEKNLPRCIAAIHNSITSTTRTFEIIVVINRCTDRTEEVARSLGSKIVSYDGKNLSAIRNAGVKQAQGEIVVTIDADSLASANLFTKIEQSMMAHRYIGGGVFIVPERLSLGIMVTALMLLPVILYYNVFGGVFFCRREDYWAIGGFNEELVSVEDIDFGVRLKKFGKTKKLAYRNLWSAWIVTSCRKFDVFGDWYFVLHPKEFIRLLGGKDRKMADKVWYDFKE